ncbi:MAG: helix-turn-helix transcriptional regulator [Chitinophagaceae bacterium]
MRNQENITPIDQYVIETVKNLRKQQGLTQQDIATIIGTHRTFVTDAESSNRPHKYSLRHVNMLAKHFGISPRLFLPDDPLAQEMPKDESNNGSNFVQVLTLLFTVICICSDEIPMLANHVC